MVPGGIRKLSAAGSLQVSKLLKRSGCCSTVVGVFDHEGIRGRRTSKIRAILHGVTCERRRGTR